jgi:D-amino-acid dehydrogenase
VSTEQLSVAVVGGGILGVSAASWLRRDGHDVELIDRVAPGSPEQTSYGNAGVLANSSIVPVVVPGLLKKIPSMLLDPDSPLFVRWSYLPRLLPYILPYLRNGSEAKVREIAQGLVHICGDSVDQHVALAKDTPAAAFINHGPYAYLFTSKAVFEKDPFAFMLRREHGFRWEEKTREQLVADDPHLGENYQYGVFMLDHGWVSDPGGYVAALAGAFQRQGGTFWQAEVEDIKPNASGGVSVTAQGETRHYDRVVLSAGAWSRKLAERLGHRTPLETERGYHVVFKNPDYKPPAPYMLSDAKLVATPMDAGIRCAGLAEFGGLEAGPSKAPLRLIEKRMKALYPNFTWRPEDTESWLGHRPAPVDSLPFLGESPKARGVYFAFGTHHIGLTSGPKIGRLTADMISGRTPNVDMAPYRVGRFD